MTPTQRKAFTYWSERMPETVAALRSTIAAIENLGIPKADKGRLMESVIVLITTVADDIDRLHGEKQVQQAQALSSLLGSIIEARPE